MWAYQTETLCFGRMLNDQRFEQHCCMSQSAFLVIHSFDVQSQLKSELQLHFGDFQQATLCCKNICSL